MSDLQKLVEGFKPVTYSRVQRGDQSYKETHELTEKKLNLLLAEYKELKQVGQTARLLRDDIEFWIRRHQDYCIEGAIGAHYTELGVDKANCVFEHVIPVKQARDMLLQGVLTVKQALNTPTCLISRRNDEILREEGHVSSSPDYWNFFKRYEMFDDAKFVTYNGEEITDPSSWTLGDHFEKFGV
jgi:hypothetical protein